MNSCIVYDKKFNYQLQLLLNTHKTDNNLNKHMHYSKHTCKITEIKKMFQVKSMKKQHNYMQLHR